MVSHGDSSADTQLGQYLIRDGAQVGDPKRSVMMPESWGGMTMVFIPKPGKDHIAGRGWHPIVLANTIWKCYERLVAEDL